MKRLTMFTTYGSISITVPLEQVSPRLDYYRYLGLNIISYMIE